MNFFLIWRVFGIKERVVWIFLKPAIALKHSPRTLKATCANAHHSKTGTSKYSFVKHQLDSLIRSECSAEAAPKVKWVVYSGPAAVAIVSSRAIWAQAKKELDMLVAYWFSWTEFNTAERRDEATRLYDRHINGVLTPDALVGDDDQFLDFANSYRVSRRGSYSVSAASTRNATRDLPNLLRCFLPKAVENPYDAEHVRHTGEITQAAALSKLEI
ncbi:hypothetical protein B0T10DRAFT_458007 [Thelonectria olida]|uniref:Uncharacterized protein n=1 Tax=Thelonectria olida TaxID=1576542 RepID=A0A9P8WA10_9HYPO|nr:hypothetical protein B0T10DRAFT_458007 [Thelonectria olida]